ncbi:tetratricopeptide repeat protein [Kribbella sp. NBC_00889]|uniref:tetratricopeptide repeat protein n=1 Tax=Kribbella sp. NBC_00889 TaxID=2975974 RepID=UPI0038686B1F|nr:tetratricopeptide repeat protein [Kribbella sp. NBC_00889]
MTDEDFSLQDILESRDAGTFVGRTEPLQLFEQNLALRPNDPRRRFVVSLYGDAGVGKTSLVQRWQAAATKRKCATAYVDEAFDVLSGIEQLARGLAASGSACRGFDSRLRQYRKLRLSVDSDPGAPSGISSVLTRAAVRLGIRAAGEIPIAGVLAGAIDENEVASRVDQYRAYLAGKITRHDDLELLLSPVEALSTAFVTDLRKIGQRRQIALFIDTFERTGPALNGWLLALLRGTCGKLPADIVVTVSGQHPLDPNQWAGLRNLRVDIELQVFTEAEARELLATQQIVDPGTVDVILRLSGCLPILVALLAESAARGTAGSTDHAETAVDRFLREVRDKDRQAAILAGAIPRRLDRDILEVAAGTTVDLDSLRRLPFVSAHADGYRYHDVVRTPMLRSLRRASLPDWTERQRALADHYRERLAELDLGPTKRWRDARWRELKLESTYHELCAGGVPELPNALEGLIDAYGRTSDSTAKWAQMIAQAGDDSDTDEIRSRGEQLTTLLQGSTSDELLLLDGLALDPLLSTYHRAGALTERSRLHERLKDYEAALRDLDRADALLPDRSWIVGPRGRIHADLGDYDKAFEDLAEAIRIAPDYAGAYSSRSSISRRLRKYDAALEDIGRVIELRPRDAYYLTVRSSIYRDLRRFAEAKTDLDHAHALAPTDTWVLLSRARLWRDQRMEREALADLDKAVELDPQYTAALDDRADILLSLGQYADALADLDRAIAADPGDRWSFTIRARVYERSGELSRGVADFTARIRTDPDNPVLLRARADLHLSARRYDGALRDLDRALELSPDDLSALTTRALVYDRSGRRSRGLADLDRVLELDPTRGPTFGIRAGMRAAAGQYDGAVADAERSLELDPLSALAFDQRGSIRLDHGDLDGALDDLDRAIELDPALGSALVSRAQIAELEGRYTQALADLDRAVDVARRSAGALSRRARVHERLGNLDAARADHDRGVTIPRNQGWALIYRGQYFLRVVGDHSAALHDFTQAIDRLPRTATAWIGRGETYQAMGKTAAALADFERGAELNPKNGWGLYRQALIRLGQGRDDDAAALLESALSSLDDEADLPRPDLRRLVRQPTFLTALGAQRDAINYVEGALAEDLPADLLRQIGEELTELGEFIGADKVAPVLDVVRSGQLDADVGGLGVEGQ